MSEAVAAGRLRRWTPWLMAALGVVVVVGSAQPQGSIDAGKTPAQMFADTCSNCHRRPQDLKRGASAGFLRQHYTPGAQEAAAMAAYLASLPAGADPKAKAKPPVEKDKAEKAKVQQAQVPPPKGPLAKGKRDLAKGAEPELPPPAVEVREEVATVPKLEPFEE